MSARLDEIYFTWLCEIVDAKLHKSPKRTHWRLLKQLFTTEFIWFVANDESRAEDGKNLRHEFFADVHESLDDPHWMTQPCSVLELLIGMARRLEFLSDSTTEVWFWHLIDTAGLYIYNDSVDDFSNDVNEIIEKIMWRLYDPDGNGGLFPLRRAEEDQRKVELWYQLNAYLIENY